MKNALSTESQIVIAERLKTCREKAGYSHDRLVIAIKEHYGVELGKTTLLNYEVTTPHHSRFGAVAGMNIGYLKMFADFYKVSSDYLLGLTDDPSTDTLTRAAVEATGLSGKTVEHLMELKSGISGAPDFAFSDDLKLKALNYILTNEYGDSFLIDVACCIWSNFDRIADEIRVDDDGEEVRIVGDENVFIEDSITKKRFPFYPKQLIPALLVEIQNTILHWRTQEGTDNQKEANNAKEENQ